jgi:TonB family protein
MQGERQNRGKSRIRLFIVVSLFLHFLIVWVYENQRNLAALFSVKPLKPLQVVLIQKERPDQQIVEFEKRSEESPLDAQFLGKYNHKVEKEMVQQSKSSEATLIEVEKIQSLLEKTRPAKPKMGESSAIAKFFPKDIFRENAQESHQKKIRMNRSPASNAIRDHIQKIEVGNQTLLNTSEFKFYSYFTRIKHKVHRNWTDRIQGAALKAWMVGRPLASSVTHETQLIIVLNQSGKIEDILVKKSSGIQALDKASVEAFLESGPFPNPPKDLIQNQENIQITWSFYVNVT